MGTTANAMAVRQASRAQLRLAARHGYVGTVADYFLNSTRS